MKYKNIIFTISLFITMIIVSFLSMFYLKVDFKDLLEQICFSIVGSCVFTIPSFLILLYSDYIKKMHLIDSMFYNLFHFIYKYNSISNLTLSELDSFSNELRSYNYRLCEIQDTYLISNRYKCDDVTMLIRDMLLICNRQYDWLNNNTYNVDISIDTQFCDTKKHICDLISQVLKLKCY